MSKLPQNYVSTVARLKEQIQQARMKTVLTVNTSLLQLYWEIGAAILEMQQDEGWGAKVIDRLSADLKADFPDFKGLSVRNLMYMVRFAKTFPAFVQQPAAQIQVSENQQSIIVQQAAAQLPWGHLQVLMDKVTDAEELQFYIQKSIDSGWSRNILTEQINTDLFKRQGNAISNFSNTLPSSQSDLVQQTFKSPYIFDFLNLSEEARERDLENGLIEHLKKFMLELGRGFAYVGRQKNLVVQGDDFFLDLLFYNYNLHCFVVFELKIGDFKPEYAGKLNFYVNTINEQLKSTGDNPTIGILLCKTPNETVVRYSLQGIENAIGVSEYQLSTALPKQLKGELPSIEELEAEIEKEIEELKKPSEKKLEYIKSLVQQLNEPAVQEKRNAYNTAKIFRELVNPLRNGIWKALSEIGELFDTTEIMLWTGPQGHYTDETVFEWLKEHRETNEFRIEIKLEGFKPAGTKAFMLRKDVRVIMDSYRYLIFFDRHQDAMLEKLYHQLPEQQELEMIIDKTAEAFYDDIEQQLKRINPDLE